MTSVANEARIWTVFCRGLHFREAHLIWPSVWQLCISALIPIMTSTLYYAPVKAPCDRERACENWPYVGPNPALCPVSGLRHWVRLPLYFPGWAPVFPEIWLPTLVSSPCARNWNRKQLVLHGEDVSLYIWQCLYLTALTLVACHKNPAAASVLRPVMTLCERQRCPHHRAWARRSISAGPNGLDLKSRNWKHATVESPWETLLWCCQTLITQMVMKHDGINQQISVAPLDLESENVVIFGSASFRRGQACPHLYMKVSPSKVAS